MQHYYPPDSSIPRRVPEFYFNLSVIYFILVTIGVLLCYPYDKNDPYLQTLTEEESELDDLVQDETDEISSLMKAKTSPSSSSTRKSFTTEVETDVKDVTTFPEARAEQHLLDLNPKILIFEPICYVFEMCMVFTNVGGEI